MGMQSNLYVSNGCHETDRYAVHCGGVGHCSSPWNSSLNKSTLICEQGLCWRKDIYVTVATEGLDISPRNRSLSCTVRLVLAALVWLFGVSHCARLSHHSHPDAHNSCRFN